MKTFELSVSDEFKDDIANGATHVCVEYMEYPAVARGSVIFAGSKEDCEHAQELQKSKIIIATHGGKPYVTVWEASVVSDALSGKEAQVMA